MLLAGGGGGRTWRGARSARAWAGRRRGGERGAHARATRTQDGLRARATLSRQSGAPGRSRRAHCAHPPSVAVLGPHVHFRLLERLHLCASSIDLLRGFAGSNPPPLSSGSFLEQVDARSSRHVWRPRDRRPIRMHLAHLIVWLRVARGLLRLDTALSSAARAASHACWRTSLTQP